MKDNKLFKQEERGIALLIALIVVAVLLGLATTLLSITIKQHQLSSTAYASENAFQVANALMECILYKDAPKSGVSPFDVPGDSTRRARITSLYCVGDYSDDLATSSPNTVGSGMPQYFLFPLSVSDQPLCAGATVYKFHNNSATTSLVVNGIDMRPGRPCPPGGVCTFVHVRGYSTDCTQVATDPRVVEREYTMIY